MARESFDKEIQLLRLLMLTSGAYSRQQLAERLGISVHTFDKTARRLKEIVQAVSSPPSLQQDKELAAALRLNYYETTDPLLLFLFRAKSVKESESGRLPLLLTALKDRPMTALELLDCCCVLLPPEQPQPDEKTIRSDLKYLEEVGVIRKEAGSRPFRYRLYNDLVAELSREELRDLYDFVDIMANTRIPSVQGYLLRDNLKTLLRGLEPEDTSEAFLYKYHYPSRILDEAHLSALLHAIEHRRKVAFVYFSPKSRNSYGSQNTNPLFKRTSPGRKEHMLPLKIVYDHQYGRWYVLGHQAKRGIVKYRMEGLTQVEEAEEADAAFFAERLQHLENRLRFSWLVDTGETVRVKARFFHPEGGHPSFIKERVELQGQWGRITEEEGGGSFIYEIEVNGTMEIKPWLRSFGSSCEVLEPDRLRNEFIAEWKELYACYEPV